MSRSVVRWLAPLLGYAVTGVAWSLANRAMGDANWVLDGFGVATVFFLFSYSFVHTLYKEADGERKSFSAAATFGALPYLGIAFLQAILAISFASAAANRAARGISAAAIPVFAFFLIFIIRRAFSKLPPGSRA